MKARVLVELIPETPEEAGTLFMADDGAYARRVFPRLREALGQLGRLIPLEAGPQLHAEYTIRRRFDVPAGT